MRNLLNILEENCNLSNAQLAAMTGKSEKEIEEAIEKFKEDGILIGNRAIINWDKSEYDYITALIEVKVIPQKGVGFDRIAEKIWQFDEVDSIYLMSGGYEFCVMVSGPSLKEISQFIGRKLSTIEGVTGTSTHFILKKYKEKHLIFEKNEEQEERFVFD